MKLNKRDLFLGWSLAAVLFTLLLLLNGEVDRLAGEVRLLREEIRIMREGQEMQTKSTVEQLAVLRMRLGQ